MPSVRNRNRKGKGKYVNHRCSWFCCITPSGQEQKKMSTIFTPHPFHFPTAATAEGRFFEKYRKTSTASFSKHWCFMMPQAIQSLKCSKGNIPPVTQSWAVSLHCAGMTVYVSKYNKVKKHANNDWKCNWISRDPFQPQQFHDSVSLSWIKIQDRLQESLAKLYKWQRHLWLLVI